MSDFEAGLMINNEHCRRQSAAVSSLNGMAGRIEMEIAAFVINFEAGSGTKRGAIPV